jgi:hypothetical protein
VAALCLFLAELLKFEITSTKTVSHLGVIASPHPASILKTFSHQSRCKISWENQTERDHLGEPGCRWNNIRMNLKEK